VTFSFSKASGIGKQNRCIADFDVCNKKTPMNITIKGKIQRSKHLYKPVKINGIFANYL
jgi:hypothetical protein